VLSVAEKQNSILEPFTTDGENIATLHKEVNKKPNYRMKNKE
jgi:hypothetical protein